MSEYKCGNIVYITGEANPFFGQMVQLRDRFNAPEGEICSHRWTIAKSPFGCVCGSVSERDIRRIGPTPAPIIGQPNPGIKRDFFPGGHEGKVEPEVVEYPLVKANLMTGQVETVINREVIDHREPVPLPAVPSHAAVVEGVRRWQQIAPKHRRAMMTLQGDLVTVRVISIPSLIEVDVVIKQPDTVEGTMDTLDHAFTDIADTPYPEFMGKSITGGV